MSCGKVEYLSVRSAVRDLSSFHGAFFTDALITETHDATSHEYEYKPRLKLDLPIFISNSLAIFTSQSGALKRNYEP